MDENLDSHSKSVLAEVEVNTGDLAVIEGLWHTLRGSGGLNGVTIDENGVSRGHTVGLEDVDSLNWIFVLAGIVHSLDVLHGTNDHFSEEIALGVKKL